MARHVTPPTALVGYLNSIGSPLGMHSGNQAGSPLTSVSHHQFASPGANNSGGLIQAGIASNTHRLRRRTPTSSVVSVPKSLLRVAVIAALIIVSFIAGFTLSEMLQDYDAMREAHHRGAPAAGSAAVSP